MKNISIYTTGGTIDKDYPRGRGIMNFEIGEPAIERILSKLQLNFKYEIKPVLKKDSLELTDEDRFFLKEKIESDENERILVTHGTDTLIETAKVLDQIKEKTIFLVGSSIPETFKGTDADFNIGYAISSLQIYYQLGIKGAFIAMNGDKFSAGDTEKGEDGVFRKNS